MSWEQDPNIYDDPVTFLSRKGTAKDPFKYIKETVQIINGKAELREVPERDYKVKVSGENTTWYEVVDEELEDNFFQVDYFKGTVLFTANNNGKTLTFEYYGRGVYLAPDSRVYLTQSNDPVIFTASEKFSDIDREILEQKNRVDTLITENPQPSEVVDMRIDRDGNIYNTARDRINAEQKKIDDARVNTYENITYDSLVMRLNEEYKELKDKITRTVNVADFGAIGDGVYDCSNAFSAAIADGHVRVEIPEGTFIIRGLKLPSYVHLVGKGKGLTTLKLHEDVDASEWVITNADHDNGNQYICVEGMSLDWNAARQGGLVATGDIHSSCLTYAHVTYGWIKDVEGINPALHCFDITSPAYDYSGDGNRAPNGSKYIWASGVSGYGFGDDGLTTHHSDYIFIENTYFHDPSGTAHPADVANSNGIEIDDGSRHVFITNGMSERCFGGLEIKAHKDSSAATNVHVDGYISINDNRSYNFRHIGHHLSTDPESLTAYDITANNLVSIAPIFTNLYANSTPRALVISAYKNVSITNFTAIGDPNYDYKNNPVIALQYRSRNINLTNINIRNFKTASVDIRLYGGAQRTDKVNITGVTLYKSALQGIGVGGSIQNVNISNVNAVGENKTNSIALSCVNSQVNVNNFIQEGYATAASIAGKTYSFIPNNFKNGTRIATTSGEAKSNTSFIAASTVDPVADGSKVAVISSSSGKAKGTSTAVIATTGGCNTNGIRNAVIASSGGSSTVGSRSLIASSNASKMTDTGAVARTILSSNNVINDSSYTVTGGYGSSPSTANRKWELNSLSGNIKSTGTITGSSTFSDYAEYFESVDGSAIPTGIIVTLDGDKIKIANEGDDMLGVISETAGAVLGQADFYWQDRYLRNEFGGLIYEEITDGSGRVFSVPKENPDYNPDQEYESREDRPEWNIVGLLGQIHIRIDETVNHGDYISPKDGLGTKSTDLKQWKVMKITTPYDATKGYGVALCLVK